MEVHAHTHTARKKWTHYFWEFLMLFLAVFCGFLAEYQLEHIIEHQREKKYIISFIEDLKMDTTAIRENIESKKEKIKTYDSLILFLSSKDPNHHSQSIYFYARKLTRGLNFFSTDRTIKQLKNSGGLRLITNQKASDSIIAYDHAVERIYITQLRQEDELKNIQSLIGKLLDPLVLETMVEGENIIRPTGKPLLRTVNKEFLLDFIYDIHQLKGSDALNSVRLHRLKQRATGIISFLKTVYHLK